MLLKPNNNWLVAFYRERLSFIELETICVIKHLEKVKGEFYLLLRGIYISALPANPHFAKMISFLSKKQSLIVCHLAFFQCSVLIRSSNVGQYCLFAPSPQ